MLSFFYLYVWSRRKRREHVPREREKREEQREREEEGISKGTLIEKSRNRERMREYETSFFLLV